MATTRRVNPGKFHAILVFPVEAVDSVKLCHYLCDYPSYFHHHHHYHSHYDHYLHCCHLHYHCYHYNHQEKEI